MPATSFGVTAGGFVELVEFKTALSAVAQEFDFTGLDGDTDLFYVLRFSFVGAEIGSVDLFLNNDEDTANYTLENLAWTSSGGAGSGSANPRIGTYGVGETGQGWADIHCSRFSGVWRMMQVNSGTMRNSTDSNGRRAVIDWENTADNITSIKLKYTVADGFGVGSWAGLFKIKQS